MSDFLAIIIFMWMGYFIGQLFGENQEREKWCTKSHTEKAAFDLCMKGDK